MTWARLDDGFHGHPKTRDVSLAAVGLFCLCLSYAADYATDGFVPESFTRDRGRGRIGRRALIELVEQGLLEEVAGGHTVHDFLDYNPSRAELQEKRAGARERQSRKRQKAAQGSLPWSSPDGSVTRDSHAPVTPGGGGQNNGSHNGEHRESPALVREVVDILATCSRFVIDPIATPVGVENMLAAHPAKDPIRAAHTAAGWASDPAWKTTSPTKALDIALQKQPVHAGRTREERAADDMAALERLTGRRLG